MYKLTKEQCQTVIENASRKLAKYCEGNKLGSVVVGVSGGLDSAVILGLACHAMDKHHPELKVIRN